MTVEMAKDIKTFLNNNSITSRLNIMGGEFFCNPDWVKILTILVVDVDQVRIVTNGDWAVNPDAVVKFMADHPQCYFDISKDRWHTNKNVDLAEQICVKNNIRCFVATSEETSSDSIVPIGNSRFEYNLYSSFSRYCSKPDRKYEFLIDEKGEIFKCSFGAWPYANILEYLDGGFAERFKSFNRIYYDHWIPNCRVCIQTMKRVMGNGWDSRKGK